MATLRTLGMTVVLLIGPALWLPSFGAATPFDLPIIASGAVEGEGWQLIHLNLSSSILVLKAAASFEDTDLAVIGNTLYYPNGTSFANGYRYGVVDDEGDVTIRYQDTELTTPRIDFPNLEIPPTFDQAPTLTSLSQQWTIGCIDCDPLPAEIVLLVYAAAPTASWTYDVFAEGGRAGDVDRGREVFAADANEFGVSNGTRVEASSPRLGVRVRVENTTFIVRQEDSLVANFRDWPEGDGGLSVSTPSGFMICPCGPSAFEPFRGTPWNFEFRIDRLSYHIGPIKHEGRPLLFGANIRSDMFHASTAQPIPD